MPATVRPERHGDRTRPQQESAEPSCIPARLGASTAYPLLLHIYAEVDACRATGEQAESCLEAIESFIVRRYLVDVPTNVLNRLFIAVIGNLPPGEPIDVALGRELSRDKRWPDDDRVRDGVATVHYYSNGRAHQQRLVLQRLESYLRAEVDLDFDSAKLSIEHVLPQTLSDGWKKQLVDAGHDPREVFERVGHTLGNLTLTAWNSKLSNQMFERKQEILQDSDLKLNEHLAKASQWGVEEIQKRSEVLADAANALWSAPVPGVVLHDRGSTGVAWTTPWQPCRPARGRHTETSPKSQERQRNRPRTT